jgi:copper resistance protein C
MRSADPHRPPSCHPPDRRPHARARTAALAAIVLAGTGSLCVALAAPASAHDQLRSTVPADGATVSAPTRVVLTFGEPVLELGTANRVAVTGPEGLVDGALNVDGATVSTTFDAPLSPGGYRVQWRVASDDGHPVSGSFAFTASAGTTMPSVLTATRVAGPPTSDSRSDGPDWLLPVLLVGAAAAAGAIVVAKRRTARGDGPPSDPGATGGAS